MRLSRPARSLPMISIIPLVDVLMILLFFFLVTSTFLDLDMLPLVEQDKESSGRQTEAQKARTILLRIVPGGDVVTGGERVPAAGLRAFLRARRDASENVQLLLLPMPQADVQALVGVLDAAVDLGIADVKVIRFGGGP